MKHPPGPKDIELRLITGLMEKGYKLTPQRREIISVLSNDMAHPGAMDILKKVKKKAPQISLSTVYYTLNIFKNEGLILELEFYDRDNRYDINVSNHINLICKKCGKIEKNLSDAEVEAIDPALPARREPPPDPGQCIPLPLPQRPPRRRHAGGRQPW